MIQGKENYHLHDGQSQMIQDLHQEDVFPVDC
jgi:hypothetical protein